MHVVLSFLLFILFTIPVMANERFAQRDTLVNSDTIVSLKVVDKAFHTVVLNIAQQTGRSYLESVNGPLKPVSINEKRIGMHQAMLMAVKDQGLDFDITNSSIIVRRKTGIGDTKVPESVVISLSGKVLDNIKGRPIPNATIQIENVIGKGAISDAEGNFRIDSVPLTGRLIISHLTYKSQICDYAGAANLTVTLMEELYLLKKFISKGYYITMEELNTGSVSTTTSEELANHPVGDPLRAAGGTMSGTLITQTTGVTGGDVKMRIRGQNSIANGNDPLVIVDGVPVVHGLTQGMNAAGQLGLLINEMTEEIDTIEVLKDADATSIYGSRGANGVVLITTKKTKAGRTKVTADVSHGLGASIRRLDLMHTPEYLRLRRQALTGGGKEISGTDHDLNGNWDTARYTDWQKELIGRTAHITSAAVSVSGGTPGTQFRAAGSFRQETTVFPGDFDNKKYTGSIAVLHHSDNSRFTFGTRVHYGENTFFLPQTDLTTKIYMAPNAPAVYDTAGVLNWQNNTFLFNPMAYLRQTSRTSSRNARVNLSMTYRVLRDLDLKITYGYSSGSIHEAAITPFISLPPSTSNAYDHRINITATNEIKLWIIEPQISYKRLLFRQLQTEFTTGATLQQTSDERQYWSYSGFANDRMIENPGFAMIKETNRDEGQYRYAGVFMRLGTVIKDKYVLNLTGRSDGGSRLGPDYRIGQFGAIGVAWLFYKEPFIQRTLPFLSFGKLRGSIGISGNDQFPDYRYRNIYIAAPSSIGAGLEVAQLVNPSISWETNVKRESGLELGFRNNAIILKTNAFYNTSTNQLVSREVSYTTGFNAKMDNVPTKIVNKGLEFELQTRNISRRNFSWRTFFNLTCLDNKLNFYGGRITPTNAKRIVTGYPLNVRFLYDYTGISPVTGLFTFRDVNKDGHLDETDQIPVPLTQRFYGGLSNMLTYKNLTLEFLLQFVGQQGYSDNSAMAQPGVFLPAGSNVSTSYTQAYQRYSSFDPVASDAALKYRYSTAAIVNADFIRFKNLALSYSLPQSWMQRIKVQEASLQFKAENLLTITRFPGYDPETQEFGVLPVLPPIRIISFGMRISL